MVVKRDLYGIFFVAAIAFFSVFVLASLSTAPASMSVNQSINSTFNITVNNTAANGINFTQVNISFPGVFTIYAGTNGTDSPNFISVQSGNILVWANISAGGFIANGTWQNFWVNATASTPGTYNITVTTLDTSDKTNTSNVTVIVNDTVTPSTVAVDVQNGSYLSKNYIGVNASAVDNYNLSNIIVKLYDSLGALNGTNISSKIFSATGYNFANFTALVDGVYYFSVAANDTAGNTNLTGNYTVTLDTTAPTVALWEYANATLKKNTQTLTINATVSDSSGGSVCLVNANGTNQSVAVSSGWCNLSVALTALGEGNSTIKVYANDTAGNFKLNNSFVVLVDDSAPNLNITYPRNANYASNVSVLNYSRSDTIAGLAFCWYSADNGTTNSTLDGTCANLTGVTSSEGDNNWTVWANDSLGNTNYSYVQFFKDSLSPQISYGAGVAGNTSNVSRSWVFVNVSVTETNTKNITFTIVASSWDNITTYQMANSGSNTTINWTSLGAGDGTYYYNATVCDTLDQCNSSGTFMITSDTAAPAVNITYPFGTNYTSNVSVLNYSRSDATLGLADCWYTADNGTTNSTLSSTCANFTGITSSEGYNNWTVWANDTAGNTNHSYVQFFKDSLSPQISLTPSNGSYKNWNYVLVTATVTEPNTKNITFSIGNSSLLNSTSYTMANSTSNNTINFTGLVDGTYYFNVSVCDLSNHCNSSGNYSVILDNINPSVSASAGSVTDSSAILTVDSSDERSGLASCAYSGDKSGSISTGTGQTVTFSDLLQNTAYNLTVTCTDNAGNSNATAVSFTTSQSASGSSGNSGGATTLVTFYPTEQQSDLGYSANLIANSNIRLNLNGTAHYIGLVSVSSSAGQATISVSSTPQQAVFNIGDEKKFDANGDGYYDTWVRLVNIVGSTANVAIKRIYEKVPVTAPVANSSSNNNGSSNVTANNNNGANANSNVKTPNSNYWVWIVGAVIIIAGILIYVFTSRKAKAKKFVKVHAIPHSEHAAKK